MFTEQQQMMRAKGLGILEEFHRRYLAELDSKPAGFDPYKEPVLPPRQRVFRYSKKAGVELASETSTELVRVQYSTQRHKAMMVDVAMRVFIKQHPQIFFISEIEAWTNPPGMTEEESKKFRDSNGVRQVRNMPGAMTVLTVQQHSLYGSTFYQQKVSSCGQFVGEAIILSNEPNHPSGTLQLEGVLILEPMIEIPSEQFQ